METYRERSARSRKCPECDRGAALRKYIDTVDGSVSNTCRWCGYQSIRFQKWDRGEWLTESMLNQGYTEARPGTFVRQGKV